MIDWYKLSFAIQFLLLGAGLGAAIAVLIITSRWRR